MSSSFLKKSLELVETESKAVTDKRVGDNYSSLKFIGKKKVVKDLRGVGDVKKKNIFSVENIRKEREKIRKSKINKFKVKLLHKPVNEQVVNKIFELIQAPGIQDKNKDKKEEEKTAFTEEDFAKFEKEYFVQ